ncbi:protein SAMBA isoform X2 [Syzygium oleosum]|uniref:protein SAMBA isoform X2 n=1 Tax=Syzygium oleosum TaxID=219896 RepID=UPI0011D1A815|nr:protein SAMBA isoform X2 [Syzygium oleosum]
MNSSSSSPSRSSMSTAAVVGGSASNATLSAEEFPDPICVHDRKGEAMRVLKADLKAALDKEVKSMDEESWKFDGPRSRINLLSKPGGFLPRQMAITRHKDSASAK